MRCAPITASVGPELRDGQGRADPLPFNAAHFPEAPEEKGMMIYFLHGFSVFLGVLAGTAVTILTQLYFARRAQTQQTQNLKI